MPSVCEDCAGVGSWYRTFAGDIFVAVAAGEELFSTATGSKVSLVCVLRLALRSKFDGGGMVASACVRSTSLLRKTRPAIWNPAKMSNVKLCKALKWNKDNDNSGATKGCFGGWLHNQICEE